MNSVFKVIDIETGKEISERETERIAREAGLIMLDLDQFAVCEDGQIILLDDCGNTAYLDMKRFEVELEERCTGVCKDCKHFEYDSVAMVDGIPLIVAHEICKKWGDGCKTKEDGYCFMFEKKERE